MFEENAIIVFSYSIADDFEHPFISFFFTISNRTKIQTKWSDCPDISEACTVQYKCADQIPKKSLAPV